MKQTEREYAEALFMLAEEEGSAEEYGLALELVLSAISEEPQYLEFLFSPAIPLTERLGAIEEAFAAAVPENVLSFLKLICENGHIRALPECIEEYRKLLKVKQNTISADIYSAVELSTAQKTAICEKLSKKTGKNILPRYSIDTSLIGGIKIEFEGKTLDGSIKNRLLDIKDVMTR